MNRLVRGSIMVVTAAAAWACSTDLGKDADVTDHLVATPSVVLVNNTDSQSVDVEALNPDGQQLAADFSVTDNGTGISVRKDTAFLPVPGGHSAVRARFVVRGATTTTFANTSFTVSANNKSVTVPVKVVPASLDITFSNSNPLPGEIVTLTAPAGVHFTSATTVVVTGGAQVVAMNTDSTQISVVFGAGSFASTATVTGLVVDFLPGQVFSVPVTGAPITTDSLGSFNITVSTLTPAVGGAVTITIPAPFKATPASTVTIAGTTAQVTSIAADSSSLVFNVGPGGNGVVVLTGLRIGTAPALGPFSLPTVGVLTSPPITGFHITVSSLTPNTGDQVTITLPAPFKATPASTVTIPGTGTAVFSISADSSQLTFLVGPNANGPVTLTGIRIGTATTLGPFTLSTTGTLTSPPLSSFTPGYSTTTPDVNQNVTLTAAGFKFRPNTKVFFGNDQQTVISIAADSNSVTFRAHKPGASGTVSVSDIALSFLSGVGLTLNATGGGVTVSATVQTLAGASSIANAPTVDIPDAGKTGGVIDNSPYFAGPPACAAQLGGSPCRTYKFVLTTTRSFAVTVTWPNATTTDMGLYFVTPAGAIITSPATLLDCDAHGGGASAQPENCSATLTAGTYYFIVATFGPPDPTQFNVAITGQ